MFLVWSLGPFGGKIGLFGGNQSLFQFCVMRIVFQQQNHIHQMVLHQQYVSHVDDGIEPPSGTKDLSQKTCQLWNKCLIIRQKYIQTLYGIFRDVFRISMVSPGSWHGNTRKWSQQITVFPFELVARVKKTYGPRSRGETTEVFPAPIIICFTLDLPRFCGHVFEKGWALPEIGGSLGETWFFSIPKAVKIVAITLPT